MTSGNGKLEQTLINAIERAEKAARVAEKAVNKAKKAVKKVKKTQLKIKNSKSRIIAFQKISDEKSGALRDDIVEIASKAAKKNKALNKIAKMNSQKED